MSDPPRLRDLPEGGFARDLLRHAAPTPAMRPDDALRLAPVVAKIATGASVPAALLANYGVHALVALSLLSGVVLGARALRPRAHTPAPAATRVASAPATSVRPSAPPRRTETLVVQAIPSTHGPSLRPAGPPPPPPPAARVALAAPAATPPLARVAPTVPAAPAAPLPTPVMAPSSGVGAGAPPPPPRAPTLSEELALLRGARAVLRESPAEAVEVLRAGAQRFPGGQMRDDREALLIEALLRAGRRDDAATRLRAFSATSASGAQVARLRAMIQNAP
jgi:hypothetical protein